MSQTDAPNVPLHEIQKQLLEYLGTLKAVQEAEEEIEKEYSIKKDDTGLWPVDDIKKTWGKIQMEMDQPDEDRRRADWSIVIILQMLLQRIQNDASKTQSELKEDLTGSNLYDPPAETQDHSKHSEINISEETKPRKGAKTDSENLEKDNTEKIRKNTDTTDNKKNASEKLSSQNGDPGSQGNDILQRKKESEYDATKTQSKLKKDLTGSNSNDSPAETQHSLGDSADNIPEETKRSEEGKSSEKDSKNPEKDDPEKRKNADTTDNMKNASEMLLSQNSYLGSRGIYIPLTALKATKLQQKEKKEEKKEKNIRLKLIDGEPTFQDNSQDSNQYKLLKKTSHVVQYNTITKNAAWVFEILNKKTIQGEPFYEQPKICLDNSIDEIYRANKSSKPYTGTDYDRGLLAAAANHKWCERAGDDTHKLTNIIPHYEHINRGKWLALEKLCRLYVEDEGDYSKAYIYTGPLYCPEKYISEQASTIKGITEENIGQIMRDFKSKYDKALPTHCFKVIILEKDNGERELKCYEIGNYLVTNNVNKRIKIREKIQCIEDELRDYSRSIDEIERVSGLRFTKEIPENLRDRQEVMRVEFTENERNIIRTNVEIIPRETVHTFQSEE